MKIKIEYRIIIVLALLLLLSIWVSTWTIMGQRRYIQNLNTLHGADLRADSLLIDGFQKKATELGQKYDELQARNLVLLNKLKRQMPNHTVTDTMNAKQLQDELIRRIEGGGK